MNKTVCCTIALLALLQGSARAQVFAPIQPLAEIEGQKGFMIDGSAINLQIGKGGAVNGDFNGDGIKDLAIGAPQAPVLREGVSLVSTGEVFIIFGAAQGLNAGIDLDALRSTSGGDGSRGFIIRGEQQFDRLGTDLASIGDINGDGIDDLLVGAPGRTSARFLEGISYVLFGRPPEQPWPAEFELGSLRPAADDNINTGLGIVITSARVLGESGKSVAGVGDVTGDGVDDFMIGNTLAPNSGVGNSSPGFNYLIYGRNANTPWPAVLSLLELHTQVTDGTQGVVIRSNKSNDSLGRSLSAAGDFTGDGIGDILLGAPNSSEQAEVAGMAMLVPGRVSGPDTGFGIEFDLRLLEDQETVHFLSGSIADDGIGGAVAGIGDINGDGRPDIAIGGQFSDLAGDNAGIVYIVFGRDGNQPLPRKSSLGDLLSGDGSTGFVMTGNPGDRLGASMVRIGDLNDDGLGDLLIGAPGLLVNGNSAGGAYVLYGRSANSGFPAILSAEALSNASAGFVFTGESDLDLAGREVASAGDLNADGSLDFAITAELSDARSSNGGRVYVIFGSGDDQPGGATGRLSQSWYDPNRNGEGIVTEFGVFNGQPALFAAWYTYLDGKQQWMSTTLQGFSPGATSIEAPLITTEGGEFGDAFDPSAIGFATWGSVRVEINACDRLGWHYESADGSQVGDLSLVPALADLLGLPGCRDNDAVKALQFGNGLGAQLSGAWWNPARAGEGVMLDIVVRGSRPTAFFSWFTYAGGVQQWLVGSVELEAFSNDLSDIPLIISSGGQFGSAFDPSSVAPSDWGTATLRFGSCNSAELEYSGQFPGGEQQAGNISLVRLTQGLLDFECND